jgi:hypothetical protein
VAVVGCVFDHARGGRVLGQKTSKTKHFELGLGPIVDWGGSSNLIWGHRDPSSHKLGDGKLGVRCLVGGGG